MELVDLDEAAAILDCSTRTVRRLKAAGLFTPIKALGRKVKLRRAEVEIIAARIAAGEDVCRVQEMEPSTRDETPPVKRRGGSLMSSGEKAKRRNGYVEADLPRVKPRY